jgi:hypothetical protein
MIQRYKLDLRGDPSLEEDDDGNWVTRSDPLASLRRVRDEIESRRQKWKCAMFDSNPQYARVRGFEECLAIIDEEIKGVEK